MNTKQLFAQFAKMENAKFVGVRGYESTTSGQIADFVINVNFSYENAKRADLKLLNEMSEAQLQAVATKTGISLETCTLAKNELTASLIKNLSENKDDRTAQSNAQTDAFIQLGNGLKLSKTTLAVHIFAMTISKNVLREGAYKNVNSSDKTLAKKAIAKHLDLRQGKFASFIIDNFDSIKVMGEVIEN